MPYYMLFRHFAPFLFLLFLTTRDEIRTAIGLHKGGDAGPTHLGASSNRDQAARHLWRGARWSLLNMLSTSGTYCVFFGFDASHQKEMLAEWIWCGTVRVDLLVDKKSAEVLGKLNDDNDNTETPNSLYPISSHAYVCNFRSWQSTREPRADIGKWEGLLDHKQLIMLAKAQAESEVAEALSEMDTDTLFSPALDQDFLGNVTFTLQVTATQFFQTERADLAENYDSKLQTGLVGLRNQGATCYLNGILQMLFHIDEFRKAIFQLPVDEDASTRDSSTLALQAVFKKLQLSSRSVATDDLTTAFGWTSDDAFLQQDAQEMMGKLLERLQDSTLGSRGEGFVEKLFSGRLCSFIKCLNVPMESNREEEFSHIQLDVIGCSNIYDSLRKFVAKDRLEGENKYDAGPAFGKQDAEKGVIFLTLPPVLTIVLKRFEFDVQQMCFVKVHDNHTFPEYLNLDEFVREDYKDETKGGTTDYVLHSVLVHSGDVGAGHYYTYIRPSCSMDYSKLDKTEGGEWYRFNDERVCKVSAKEAVDYNFGAGDLNRSSGTSAYMLLYVRAQDAGTVMQPGPPGDAAVPANLLQKLVTEERLRQRQESVKRRAVMHMNVSYITEQNLCEFDGYTMYNDFVSDESATKLKIFQQPNMLGVIVAIMKQCGMMLSTFRLWKCRRSQLEGGIGTFVYFPLEILQVERDSSSNDSDESIDELDEGVSNGTMFYIDTRQCIDIDSEEDLKMFNECQESQEDLLVEDKILMDDFRKYLDSTGLYGDFDAIANNNAVSSYNHMKSWLKNSGGINRGRSDSIIVNLCNRAEVLVGKWREHVRWFYPAAHQSGGSATSDLLCFVKVFDPLHALPSSIARAPETQVPAYHCELLSDSENEPEKAISSEDDENGSAKNPEQPPRLGKSRRPNPEGGQHVLPLKFLEARYFSRDDSFHKVINDTLQVPLQKLLATASSESADFLKEILHGGFNVSLQKSGTVVSLEQIVKVVQARAWERDRRNDPHLARPRYDESNALNICANWTFSAILQYCKTEWPLWGVEEAIIIVIEPRGGMYRKNLQERVKAAKFSYADLNLLKSMHSYSDWWDLVVNRIPVKLAPFDKETALALHMLRMEARVASSAAQCAQSSASGESTVGEKRKGKVIHGVNSDSETDYTSMMLAGTVDAIVSLNASPDSLRDFVVQNLGFYAESAEQLPLYYQVFSRIVVYVSWSASVLPAYLEPFGYHDAMNERSAPSLRESQYEQMNEIGHACYIHYRLAPIARFARKESAGRYTREVPLPSLGLRSLEVRIVDARLLNLRAKFLQATGNQSQETKDDYNEHPNSHNASNKRSKGTQKMNASQDATQWPPRRQHVHIEGLSEIDFRGSYPELPDCVFMVTSNGIATGEFVKTLRAELGLPLGLNETRSVSSALKDVLLAAGSASNGKPSPQFPLLSDFCEFSTVPKFPIALLRVNHLDISVMSPEMTLGTILAAPEPVPAASAASLSPLTSEDIVELDEDVPNPMPPCWFNALDCCTAYEGSSSYIAVQHISHEDILFMRNQAGTVFSTELNVAGCNVVSVPIVVYSFILHGSACAPIFSDDFPRPFLSYVREDDTVDTLTDRFAEMTGEFIQAARFAVIKEKLPTFLRRSTDSVQAAEEKIQTVWQVLAAKYSVPTRVGESVVLPIPQFGIQRSASELLANSGSTTPKSIKIS